MKEIAEKIHKKTWCATAKPFFKGTINKINDFFFFFLVSIGTTHTIFPFPLFSFSFIHSFYCPDPFPPDHVFFNLNWTLWEFIYFPEIDFQHINIFFGLALYNQIYKIIIKSFLKNMIDVGYSNFKKFFFLLFFG